MAGAASCCDDVRGLGAAAGTTAREIEVVGSYPTRQISSLSVKPQFSRFSPWKLSGNTLRTWASNL